MKLIEIPTGTRLEVSWFLPEQDGADAASQSRDYVSQLLEPAHDGHLVIAVPIYGFRLVSWPAEARMRVTFTQPNSCLWAFTASYADELEINQIKAFRIKADSALIRSQRREWYRLPCSLDMTFRFVEEKDAEDEAKEGPCPVFQAITRDISGGGAAFVTDGQIDLKTTEIEVSLDLDSQQRVFARGHVVRVSELDGKPARHQISVQFTEISHPNQETLVQYVFQQQMRQIRKTK